MSKLPPVEAIKGRGAPNNATPVRFNLMEREHDGDWIDVRRDIDGDAFQLKTTVTEEFPKSILSFNSSPDLPFDRSVNAYRGCEHGCIYCYARNVHEYWGYSAGLDFEQKILVKKNAPQLLRKFLVNPKWECSPIMLSGNTDCYQPAEQTFRLTRALLEVCNEFNQPVGILTKNSWI